jgi:hypothetical protein
MFVTYDVRVCPLAPINVIVTTRSESGASKPALEHSSEYSMLRVQYFIV